MRDKIIEYYESKGGPIELGDIINASCWLSKRWEKPSPEAKMISRMSDIIIEKHWSKYLSNSMAAEKCEAIDMGDVYCRSGCATKDGEYIDFHLLSFEFWSSVMKGGGAPSMSNEMLNLIQTSVVRAHLRELKTDSVTIIFLNRNNQYFLPVRVSNLTKDCLEEGLKKLHMFDTGDKGFKMCQWCPVKVECEKEYPKRTFTKSSLDWGNNIHAEVMLDIKEGVNEYLQSLNYKTSKHHDDGWIHPSEVSITKCDRRLYYSIERAPKVGKISAYLRMIFDMGHAIHDVCQEAFREDQIELSAEDEDIRLHGRCDIVEGEWVGEIKSASHNSWQKTIHKPKKEHVKQATIYSHNLGKKGIKFLYYNKNNAEIMEHEEESDPKLYKEISLRCSKIYNAHKKGVPPEQINKKSECTKCPYLEHCNPAI